jgi:hypothetical protein
MAHGKIEVKRPFSERIGKIAVMSIVEMVVELKAHAQDGIGDFIASVASFKKSLTEVSAEFKGRPDLSGVILISALIQVLAKLPTALPSLLLDVARAREAEHSLPMHGAEICKRVAQRPAFA